MALDKTERDLAASARSQNAMLEAKRFAVVGGQRRAITFTEIPLGDAGIIGTAVDVTDVAAAEARLQQHVDAHADTLDKLQTAVAIFGKRPEADLLQPRLCQAVGLAGSLAGHAIPATAKSSTGCARRANCRSSATIRPGSAQRLALYQTARANAPTEELWHMPGGQTMRVVAQPHPFGGLTFLYEDVTEKLALESDYNTLIKVQSATLDTLSEGVAVFGPDGKLKLHNAAFARIWEFERRRTGRRAACAHHRRRCRRDKFGDSAMWDQLIQAIVSGAGGARPGRSGTLRPLHPVACPVAAARRRHPGDLRRRHRPLPHRKRPARPQRGAGSRRPAQIRLHQACLL